MYYHCTLTTTTGWTSHYFWNYSFDEIINQIVIPFVNKQVIPVTLNNRRGILNLSAVSYLRIYKTKGRVDFESSEDFRIQLRDADFESNDCTQEIIEAAIANRIYPETKSTLQNQFTLTNRQIFVIMNLNDDALDSAYNGVIKPIAKKYKYKAIRIDEIQDSGNITDQIIEHISRSQVVIADLTGERPNCYYEAGFAHAIGKEMIFTIKKNTPLHFDLSFYRFIQWDTEDELRQGLDSRFKSITKRQHGI